MLIPMERKTSYSKFIDRYLDGELNDSEKQWFENEILTDSDLAKDLELHREVNDAIRETDVLKFRHKLDKIHATIEPEYQQSLTQKVIRSKYSRIAAASIVILFAVGMLMGNMPGQPVNTDKLFQQYYEVPEISGLARSDLAIDKLYLEAIACYADKQFTEAVNLFEQVVQIDKNNMKAHLAAGISNIETNQPIKAEKSFETVIEHKDNLYVDQANWYLGLCYLKMNNLENAGKQFDIVASDDRSNKQDVAKKILKKLDK